MRLVFLGSPPFATPVLERLIDSPFRPLLVVTPPSRPQGRGRKAGPSPVANLAREAGIELFQPESVRAPEALEHLAGFEADVFLVVSYGEFLPRTFIDLPSQACLNVHPSLLPRHRGATPIQAAILAGDAETGVTIQTVAMELDAGDVLHAVRTEILPGETAGELTGRLAALSGDAVLEALARIEKGAATYTPQDPEAVTMCKRLKKEHGHIDWSQAAEALDRHVRAMNPWPIAQTTLPNGTRLGVWRAQVVPVETDREPGTLLSTRERLTVACGRGALELTQVQVQGKRAMSAGDFLRGARLSDGERLGQDG